MSSFRAAHAYCMRCDLDVPAAELLDGDTCPRCRLVLPDMVMPASVPMVLSGAELDLIHEGLVELLRAKVRAHELAQVDAPFTPEDFGIPKVVALIERVAGEDMPE